MVALEAYSEYYEKCTGPNSTCDGHILIMYYDLKDAKEQVEKSMLELPENKQFYNLVHKWGTIRDRQEMLKEQLSNESRQLGSLNRDLKMQLFDQRESIFDKQREIANKSKQ